MKLKKCRMSHAQIIAIGYLLVIMAGTLTLMLPVSSRQGETTKFSEALFTATSATCVTGLVVVDTASHWSIFGQCIILLMIQIGGLGFMTMGVMFAMLMKKTISLKMRGLLQESMNSIQLGGVVKLARMIIKGTIIVEGLGAFALLFVFVPQFGIGKGIYFSVFHSVSAFCNAGFDLMGTITGEYSSFSAYADNAWLNITLMTLITVGSIGFFVWNDIRKNKINVKKYNLHTKIAISTTLIIFVVSSLLFFLFEKDGLMKDMGVRETILASFFSSVTPRTAGFNTIDTGALSNSSKLLTMLLMFIGGSPGSTAGGVKTVTTTVLVVYVWSNLRNETGCNIFGRRLPDEAIKKACNVVILNLLLAITAIIVVSYIQPLKVDELMFEVFSAIGTAGMSTGITRELTTASRLVMIILMYCGRIGSMSFALSFTERKQVPPVKLPEENVLIG